MLQGITVSNMVRFSPDDRTLYYADTYSDVMYAFDYSLADGTISNCRVFVDTKEPSGPSRRLGDRRRWLLVERGIRWLSRCALHAARQDRSHRRISGDPADLGAASATELDTLYVTSATQRIEPELLAKQPLAGGVFAVNVGVRGLPEAEYAG